jgi:hypothetical protein
MAMKTPIYENPVRSAGFMHLKSASIASLIAIHFLSTRNALIKTNHF